MGRIVLGLALLISLGASGQAVPGYTNIYTGYKWLKGIQDSGFHVPRYTTVPNVRAGVWTGAGNIGVDTVANVFYYYSGGSWRALSTGAGSGWLTTGNTGIGSGWLGTTDATDVVFKRNTIEWLRRSTSNNTIFSNVDFAGAAEDSVWGSNGTGALRRYAQSDVNGGKNRLGIYLNTNKTFVSKTPYVFGGTLMFIGNSWAGGTGGSGTSWSSLISTALGKTKATTFNNGNDLSAAYFISKNLTNGNSVDSIWFIDCTYIPFFGMASSVSGLFGVGWADGYSIPKTSSYIKASFRSLMANYWLNTDTFSVNSLGDANFRAATASDSLGSKTAVGAIGLGAFQFTKPAGKTNIVIGTYDADGDRTHQGTIVVTLDGTEIYRRNHDSLNNANRRGAAVGGTVIRAGLNYSPVVLMNLPTASSTIVVTALDDSTRFDYVGYLVDPSVSNKPFYANNFAYGAGTPYFVIPRTNVDSGNAAMQEAVQEFSNYGYPAFINNVNQGLDSINHLFDAHPSTAGNALIASGYLNNIVPLGYVPTAPSQTAGYTNLTQFVGQTAWRGFYSDGSGDVQEQAFGTSGHVWTSNGATAAPTWQAASGGSPAGNYGNIQLNRNGAFATAASDTINYNTANGFTVLNKVGIGTATPGFKLDVRGTGTEEHINIQGSGTGSIKIGTVGGSGEFGAMWAATASPTVSNYAFLGNASFSIFNVPTGGSVRFRVNNADQMIIGSAGAVQLNAYGAGILTTDGSGNVTASPLPLTGTATLNFDLTAVNSQDLTITVTGAASGDPVSLALDPASVPADITYFGWVSSSNTVSVRCSRVGGGAAVDPASGSFTARVFK